MGSKPLLMMTDPGHYEVSYVINPWMAPDAWSEQHAKNLARAIAASRKLASALEAAGADVTTIPGVEGLPDLVFPANAAIVLDRRAIVARFSCKERRGEEPVFLDAFEQLKLRGLFEEIAQFPDGTFQEGAGDCIWDTCRGHFWAGYGQRSLREAIPIIESFFGGEVVYYPKAFSPQAQAAIKARVAPEMLIEASDEDAAAFSVNAVNIGRNIVMATPPARLRHVLEDRGYHVAGIDLAPFIMSGGGAYCMTLRLDRRRENAPSMRREAERALS
jgi:N-dimethylarginine dimethylaminohydrolase